MVSIFPEVRRKLDVYMVLAPYFQLLTGIRKLLKLYYLEAIAVVATGMLCSCEWTREGGLPNCLSEGMEVSTISELKCCLHYEKLCDLLD